MSSVFERMISDFGERDGEYLLEQCMSFRPKEMKKIPLRYRLIGLGFVKGLSLGEVNEKLMEAGCEKLYARNYLEASLIFAFSRNMSYERWKALGGQCKIMEKQSLVKHSYFQGQNISCMELKHYVEENSVEHEQGFKTRNLTRYLEENIRNLSDDAQEFETFLNYNIESFSGVREKARYYFCKYLYYYIMEKKQAYLAAAFSMDANAKEEAFMELLVLKGISTLKRKNVSRKETEEILDNASISSGNLYDAFNYHYFGYVSSDWMEVLLDYYGGNIKDLPAESKQKLGNSLKIYNPKWKTLTDEEAVEQKWQEMQEQERLLDEIYARDGSSKGYQKNRSGEKSVRNYMKGNLDIDRTTLICYLLFFGNSLPKESEMSITIKRLDEILAECGFPKLRQNVEFDCFIMEYMDSKEPVDFLMESVTKYAFSNRNFFLYHMYQESVNNEEQFEKLLKTK